MDRAAELLRSVVERVGGSLRSHPERWIIAGAIVLHLPLVFTGISNSSDIWRQSDTASIARNFSTGGLHLFFPQIDWGGAGPGYVETEFPLYPFAVALLYKVAGGEHLWLGKLVSLALSAGTLVAFWALARRVVSHRAALVALAILGVSPISLRYGTAFMPEATVLFFYVLALLLFVRWLAEDRTMLLVGTGAAVALALLAKPTSIQIGAVLLIVLVRERGWRSLGSVRLWCVAALAVVPAAAWTVHARDLHLRYGNTFGVISGGDRKFATVDTFLTPDFYLGVSRTEVLWVFALGTVPLFVLGLVVAVRRRQPTVLLAGAVVIPVFYAAVAEYSSGPQGIQYHLFAVPYGALAVGLGVEALVRWVRVPDRSAPWRTRVVAVGGAATVALFLLVAAVSYLGRFPAENQTITACGERVTDIVPQRDLMVVASTSASQADGHDVNFQEPMIFYFSGRRGWSLPTDRYDPDQVGDLAAQGARWFVAYDGEPLADAPDLERYLGDRATQVGPGVDEGCGIWRLDAAA